MDLKLNLPEDVADAVRRHIDEVRQDWADHPFGVGDIASHHGLLPLSLDMGGFAALKSDGTVVVVVWDEEPVIEHPVVSVKERDICLYVGSKRYPILARLLPERDPGSRVCPICEGTGKHPLAVQARIDNLLCSCGGFGWLPDSWEST